MVKYLVVACFVAIAATSINASLIRSGSSNTGMNLMSTNSDVVQNDVQNVNAGPGFNAAPVFAPAPAFAHAPVFAPHAGFAYPPVAGYPAAPFTYGLDAPAVAVYPAHPGYVPAVAGAGYENVNSASSNVGSNVLSTDSNVYQQRVQNVDSRY